MSVRLLDYIDGVDVIGCSPVTIEKDTGSSKKKFNNYSHSHSH